MHNENHAGINKTTAVIAEKYHWVRIKETVNLMIRNCKDCKVNDAKATGMRGEAYPVASNGKQRKQDNDSSATLQEHADQMLKDLDFFKRKIGQDRSRFPLSSNMSLVDSVL